MKKQDKATKKNKVKETYVGLPVTELASALFYLEVYDGKLTEKEERRVHLRIKKKFGL